MIIGFGMVSFALLTGCMTSPPPAQKEVAHRVAERVMLRENVWGGYTLDLAWEAMLEFDRVADCPEFRDYVLTKAKEREWPAKLPVYSQQPFTHVNYKLYQVTGDAAYIENFVSESERYRKEVSRSPEGAIAHKTDEPGRHLLIDQLQDYASRMAHTGVLTGDKTYFAECAEQFRIYRKIVRDSQTGLWCQGRGWLDDPMELSPGAWSRGQGWLIRGMVDSLVALPRDSAEFAKVQGYLQELAEALIAVQAPDGMWHQLLHLPSGKSAPDTTGTGLIIYNFARALDEGILDDPCFRKSAETAFEALTNYVTSEGIVLQACPGPGPLKSIEPYLGKDGRAEDGEHHAPFCVIYACAGNVLLEKLSND